MPANAVNCARPGPWGNPFVVTYDERNGWCVLTRQCRFYLSSEAVARRFAVWKYRRWIATEFARRRLDVESLRGCDLACWCGLDNGLACHVDVLLVAANG